MTYPYRCKLYHPNPKWWTNFLAAVSTLPFSFLVLLSAATKAVSNYTVNTSAPLSLSVLALYVSVSKHRLACVASAEKAFEREL